MHIRQKVTAVCKWLSVKSRVFLAPWVLWDRAAEGRGFCRSCRASWALHRAPDTKCKPRGAFPGAFQPFASLLPVLKVKTAIMQALGRTDLKSVEWAQREASLAPLTELAFFFNQRIFSFIFVVSTRRKHHRLEGLCSTGVS